MNQVRIVQRGGWRDAILPLIISLDEEPAAQNLSPPPASCRQAILCYPVFFCVFFYLGKF